MKYLKTLVIFLISGIGLLIIILIIYGGGFGHKADGPTINDGVPLIFAHRGISYYSVENSLESFAFSDDLGFKAIETDISFTKDLKLVIFHDKNCKNLLGIDEDIDKLNWADINDKHLLRNGIATENKILSLENGLNIIGHSKVLYLDIKDVNKSVADSLLKFMSQYNVYNNVLIADGNFLFLAYLKFKNPKIRIVLEGFNKGKEWLYYIIPKKIKPDFYSSFLSKVDDNHIRFLTKNDLLKRKIVYGVNSTNIKTASDFGIQNIILDYDSTMGSFQNIEQFLKKN